MNDDRKLILAALEKARDYMTQYHNHGAWWHNPETYDAIGEHGWLTKAIAAARKEQA